MNGGNGANTPRRPRSPQPMPRSTWLLCGRVHRLRRLEASRLALPRPASTPTANSPQPCWQASSCAGHCCSSSPMQSPVTRSSSSPYSLCGSAHSSPRHHAAIIESRIGGMMQERRQTTRHSLQAILLIIFAVPLHLALGQSAPPPTLNEILLRLENNLNHYYKDVPNFFCNEHVVSSMTYAKKHPSTVTDSVFRVVRSPSEISPNRTTFKPSMALRQRENKFVVQRSSAESLQAASTPSLSARLPA